MHFSATWIFVCLIVLSFLLNAPLWLSREFTLVADHNEDAAAKIKPSSSLVPFSQEDRILVTGAAGFIGMHTSLQLIKSRTEGGIGLNPSQVVGIDNFDTFYSVQFKSARQNELLKAGVQVFNASVCESDILEEIFRTFRFTHVIHLAAQPGVRYAKKRPDKYIKSNIECFDVLLETIRTVSSSSYLIYASSSSVYGANTKKPYSESDRVDSPVSLYGATKRTNELLAFTYFHNYGLQSTGLRFFTVYGEWGRPDMAALKFIHSIETGNPLKLFNNGKFERDFTYVGDIVEGIMLACQFRSPKDQTPGLPTFERCAPEIFNLGNSKPIRIDHVVQILEQTLHKPAILVDGGNNSDEVASTHADIRKAFKLLGWQPQTSVEAGLQKVAEWYRAYPNASSFLTEDSNVRQSPALSVFSDPQVASMQGKRSEQQEDEQQVLLEAIILTRTADEVLARKSQEEPVIAILVAVTSRGTDDISRAKSHPFGKILLQSMFSFFEKGFEYWVYVGYDLRDEMFDQESNRRIFEDYFQNRADKLLATQGIIVQMAFVKYPQENAKPGPIYNFISAAAFADGAEYFFRISDDIGFSTLWAYRLVDQLAKLSPPNVGVVGPTVDSAKNLKILPADFTHRTHILIHGTHLPRELTDWWIDEWISSIYGEKNTVRNPTVRLRHRSVMKQRYEVNHSVEALLPHVIARSRAAIQNYVHQIMLHQCQNLKLDAEIYLSISKVAALGANLAATPTANDSSDGIAKSSHAYSTDDARSGRHEHHSYRHQASMNESPSFSQSLRAQNNSDVVNIVLRVANASKFSTAWVTVMLVNSAILPMALNWICNIRNQGLTHVLESTVFICLDRPTIRALRKTSYHAVFWRPGDTDWRGKQNYGSSNYFILINHRQQLILDLLQQNVSILVAEPDATWYGDLMQYVESEELYRNADALAYDDGDGQKSVVPCGGLLFLRATESCKNLMRELNSRHTAAMEQRKGIVPEQSVLQHVWKSVKGNFVILPKSLFSSGLWYRQTNATSEGLLYIHANYMKGVENKITALKKHRQWFIGGVSRCYKKPLTITASVAMST